MYKKSDRICIFFKEKNLNMIELIDGKLLIVQHALRVRINGCISNLEKFRLDFLNYFDSVYNVKDEICWEAGLFCDEIK
jgi:hypothetical protein